MTGIFRDIKDKIYENSPNSSTVYKILGTTASLYTIAILWHHKTNIYKRLSENLEIYSRRFNTKKDDQEKKVPEKKVPEKEDVKDKIPVFINSNGERICEL